MQGNTQGSVIRSYEMKRAAKVHVQPAESLYVPERSEPYSKLSSILGDLLDDILFWAQVSAWEFKAARMSNSSCLGVQLYPSKS